ncbi:MAG TPA: sulfite exporter TauE/SafE family protein [Acidimicrobiales bacterium]|nr:sulfite exporter TauE/SafE family protein [Acidimicrobiales bacterium]
MPVTELALAGLCVGFLVGMTGMGGGAIMTPLLVLGFGISPTAAVGSDLAVSLAIKPVGAVVHQRAGTVRWDLVRYLLPTAVPAAFAGAWLISLLGDEGAAEDIVRAGIGVVLVVGVAAMAIQSAVARRRGPTTAPQALRPVATLIVGLIGGLMVGFTSIGSGSVIIVLLVLLHPGLRPSELVGTDLVQAIPLVAAALVGHLLFGTVDLGLSAGLLLGALPGVYLGAKATLRMPSGAVRSTLCVLLLGSALALWHVPTAVLIGVCGSFAVSSIALAVTKRRRRVDAPGAGHSGITEIVAGESVAATGAGSSVV